MLELQAETCYGVTIVHENRWILDTKAEQTMSYMTLRRETSSHTEPAGAWKYILVSENGTWIKKNK